MKKRNHEPRAVKFCNWVGALIPYEGPAEVVWCVEVPVFPVIERVLIEDPVIGFW